jgi:hypothetical protein
VNQFTIRVWRNGRRLSIPSRNGVRRILPKELNFTKGREKAEYEYDYEYEYDWTVSSSGR